MNRVHSTVVSMLSTLIVFSGGIARLQALEPPMTPEQAHQVLQKEVGHWDAETKLWMAPDAEPIVTKGTEKTERLGDHWVVSVFESTMGGAAYRGHAQFGYDPISKKFVGTWIDSMTPYLNVFEGTMKGDTIVFQSKGRDPLTGKEKTTKMMATYVDDDHRTFVSLEPVPDAPGKWWKAMEVNYTRVK